VIGIISKQLILEIYSQIVCNIALILINFKKIKITNWLKNLPKKLNGNMEYQKYLIHSKDHHPEQEILSKREFFAKKKRRISGERSIDVVKRLILKCKNLFILKRTIYRRPQMSLSCIIWAIFLSKHLSTSQS
jgi:uncharacterized short protein YbdD (DUF466 family)